MKALEKVLPILEKAKTLGERVLPNGSRLICHVPHVAPEAWLHAVYAPLLERDIISLEKQIRRPIPPVFKEFLKVANGIQIFSCSMSIDGLRANFARTGDAVWQPFSIVTPNTIERPKDAQESFFFIGGYEWDGSRLYIDSKTSKVFRSESGTAKPINEWNNFEEMLVTETIRIALLFDDQGRRIDPREPTTPD